MIDSEYIISLLQQYTPLLVVVVSTYLVGYITASILTSRKYKKKITGFKSKVNDALTSSQINNIETIFTEIKPRIVDIVNETQKDKVNPLTSNVPEKTKTTYVSFAKHKPSLDFNSIGKGDKKNPDNLTKIDGIGPYIEQRLNEIGIYNFSQISKLNIADIRLITDLIELFPNRIQSENWVEQAKTLSILENS